MTYFTRRTLLQVSAASALAGFNVTAARAAGRTLRFSYQRSSTLLTILKTKRTLEDKLAAKGFEVSWHLFTEVLTPMNSGAVDFHADVADAVPIFTQAAGAKLTLYAREAPSPTAEGIIVHADSPIQSMADLKGKTVGVSRGSGCHFLLTAALKRAGLSFHDIQPAYLEAIDGGPAFQTRRIDAWAIWDPFLAITQSRFPVRMLADATGLTGYCRYYLVEDAFAAQHPEIVQIVFDALVDAGHWAKQNPKDAAALLSPIWGDIPPSVIDVVNGRRSYSVLPVDKDQLGDQQKIADTFHEAGLIPRAIDATNVRIWTPAEHG
jgi:sulfonate transport system substrate-binding protein